jgi:hypothetical protein
MTSPTAPTAPPATAADELLYQLRLHARLATTSPSEAVAGCHRERALLAALELDLLLTDRRGAPPADWSRDRR